MGSLYAVHMLAKTNMSDLTVSKTPLASSPGPQKWIIDTDDDHETDCKIEKERFY